MSHCGPSPRLLSAYKKLSKIFNKEDDFCENIYYEIYGGKKKTPKPGVSNIIIEPGYCVPSIIMSHSDIASVPEVLCPGAHPGVIGFGIPY
jgi:hypothetical protein